MQSLQTILTADSSNSSFFGSKLQRSIVQTFSSMIEVEFGSKIILSIVRKCVIFYEPIGLC